MSTAWAGSRERDALVPVDIPTLSFLGLAPIPVEGGEDFANAGDL